MNYNKFGVILFMLIILLINSFILYKVVTRSEAFYEEPLLYGSKINNISYCQCRVQEGDLWFNQSNIILTKSIPDSNYLIKNLSFK